LPFSIEKGSRVAFEGAPREPREVVRERGGAVREQGGSIVGQSRGAAVGA